MLMSRQLEFRTYIYAASCYINDIREYVESKNIDKTDRDTSKYEINHTSNNGV